MKLLFWRNKKQTAKLDAIEREAHAVHVQNIRKIAKTRKNVDTLNKVLEQNNIILSLASVTGHR